MSSSYFHQLDGEARSRNRAKLFFGNEEVPDPLDDDVVQFAFTSGPKNLPLVTAEDIYIYLVEGVRFYTREQFKCHKSGDAYNMFMSGKVKELNSFKAGKCGEGVVLVAATVEASQALSKEYNAWCVVKDDGSVECAHCTCMAG